jgi:RecJ-like exonuclease
MSDDDTDKNTDQVPEDTPSSGENICRRCNGKGTVEGTSCPECGGSGKVITPVGGAG